MGMHIVDKKKTVTLTSVCSENKCVVLLQQHAVKALVCCVVETVI